MTTTTIPALNGATFNELNSSLPLSSANVATVGSTFVVSPNGIGLATFDNWTSSNVAAPAPSDIVDYHTVIPSGNPNPGVIQFSFTQADGAVNPANGLIGAEVIGWNSTGVLLEELSGYIPGPGALNAATLTGEYLVFTAPSVDLSVDDPFNVGYTGPTTAELTFGDTGPLPTFASTVPEPATVLLMPVMIVALTVSRIPAVRSFLAAR